jgi:hypothetical protein
MKTTIKNELINAVLELCKQNNVDIKDNQIEQWDMFDILRGKSISIKPAIERVEHVFGICLLSEDYLNEQEITVDDVVEYISNGLAAKMDYLQIRGSK